MDFRPNMEISQNMEDVPEIKLDLPNIKKEIYRVLKVNISNIFYTFFQTGLDFFFEYYSLLFKIPPPPLSLKNMTGLNAILADFRIFGVELDLNKLASSNQNPSPHHHAYYDNLEILLTHLLG